MKYGLKEVSPEEMEQAQQTALINNTEGLSSVTLFSDVDTYAEILEQHPELLPFYVQEIKFETYTGDFSNVHFYISGIWYKPVPFDQYVL